MGCIELITSYFTKAHILHIAGGYNTGKTILVKDLIATMLETNPPTQNFFYLDADKKFPKALYEKSLPQKALQNRIFVSKIPNSTKFAKTIRDLCSDRTPLKAGDVIIIDSVSEFIKQNMAKIDDYAEWKAEVEYIKNSIIPQLIRLVIRQKIKLILVHHISYDPGEDASVPYYHDLFRLIKGMWLQMKKTPKIEMLERPKTPRFTIILSYTKECESPYGDIIPKTFERKYSYVIDTKGIVFAA